MGCLYVVRKKKKDTRQMTEEEIQELIAEEEKNEGCISFFHKHEGDKIWWVTDYRRRGKLEISFDKKKIYNLWQDYDKLTKEEKELFDKENPYWAERLNKKE